MEIANSGKLQRPETWTDYQECCGSSRDCHTSLSHQNTHLWKAKRK